MQLIGSLFVVIILIFFEVIIVGLFTPHLGIANFQLSNEVAILSLIPISLIILVKLYFKAIHGFDTYTIAKSSSFILITFFLIVYFLTINIMQRVHEFSNIYRFSFFSLGLILITFIYPRLFLKAEYD